MERHEERLFLTSSHVESLNLNEIRVFLKQKQNVFKSLFLCSQSSMQIALFYCYIVKRLDCQRFVVATISLPALYCGIAPNQSEKRILSTAAWKLFQFCLPLAFDCT